MTNVFTLPADAWKSISPLKWPDYEALLRAGVQKADLARAHIDCEIAADDIAVERGRWVRRFRGDRAVVIPVHNPESGDILDLVAFRMETPRSFWTFAGIAPYLGHEALAHATYHRIPLIVHETPLEWLTAGREGIVILGWKHYWPAYFGDVVALRTHNPEFGRRLRDAMKHPLPTPPIQVAAA